MLAKFELRAVRFSCYITDSHTDVLERVCENCNLLFELIRLPMPCCVGVAQEVWVNHGKTTVSLCARLNCCVLIVY